MKLTDRHLDELDRVRERRPLVIDDLCGSWQQDAPDARMMVLRIMTRPAVLLAVFEVAKRFQGRGTGGAMLARLCRAADECGASIQLIAAGDSAAKTDRLIRFYRRHGFRKIRRTDNNDMVRRPQGGHVDAGRRTAPSGEHHPLRDGDTGTG